LRYSRTQRGATRHCARQSIAHADTNTHTNGYSDAGGNTIAYTYINADSVADTNCDSYSGTKSISVTNAWSGREHTAASAPDGPEWFKIRGGSRCDNRRHRG
jgi:hypothetical protein